MTDEDAVAHFWQVARVAGKVTRLEPIIGRFPADTVPPPAWSFHTDAVEAQRLLEAVLSGRKTAMTTPYSEYGSDPEQLPEVGDLSIVLDGDGQPRALIRTTAVEVVARADVTSEHSRADDEPTGDEDDGDGPLVLERFVLLHPRPRATTSTASTQAR